MILGGKELEEMQESGWRFNDRGLRLGDCWAIWATDPDGYWHIQFVADPEQSPEKFPSEPTDHIADCIKMVDDQLELFV